MLNETPVNPVVLSPFFLSKFEMTQAQWQRCTGVNPSAYQNAQGNASVRGDPRLHPVERVSWIDCTRALNWLGLRLPSEAQWEYAARGGTSTAWSTGAERESLRGAANIADSSAARVAFDWGDIADWPQLDDGFAEHARVDELRPNPFGLVHVHGNVLEWCADPWIERPGLSSEADESGLRVAATPDTAYARVVRGGAFDLSATRCRSAYRANRPADAAAAAVGVRPARELSP
jgi:formylglycine-generating enzyme required for sulfatase activity